MNKLLVLVLVILVSGSTFAQKKKNEKKQDGAPVEKPVENKPATSAPAGDQTNPASTENTDARQQTSGFFNHFINKYVVANRFGDYDVAKDALYDILVENPGNDSLFFTLAYLYYDNQKFTSAALVGQELLARNSKDPNALELTASSFESLGLKDRAVQYFESLYLVSNSFPALYKTAFLQFDLKRLKESQANCDIMLTKKEADELTVTFNTADNKTKDYPIRVSILNLQGMVARESGDKAAAKGYFEQALKLAPDFVQAKENLANLAKAK